MLWESFFRASYGMMMKYFGMLLAASRKFHLVLIISKGRFLVGESIAANAGSSKPAETSNEATIDCEIPIVE